METLIVGAGIAGLACAQRLRAAGAAPIVVDKAMAVGGRMATRTVNGRRFDFGAQHFSVRSKVFETFIDPLVREGVVEAWFRSESITEPERGVERRHVGAGGMRRIPEVMAAALGVRTDCEVQAVEFGADGATTSAGGEKIGPVDAVVFTAPLPQSLAILRNSGLRVPPDLGTMIQGLEYQPCLVLMAIPASDPDLREGHYAGGEPVAWIGDNHHKGASPYPALTIHGGPRFSRAHLEDDPSEWSPRLRMAAEAIVSVPLDVVQTHRWRYSLPKRTLSVGAARFVHEGVQVVLAGEVFAGARVEGAYLSGVAAAELLGR